MGPRAAVKETARDIKEATPEDQFVPDWIEPLLTIDELNVREAIDQLIAHYDKDGRAFTIVERSHGWRLCAQARYSEWCRALYPGKKVQRLSQPALETLAIIAYRQPILRSEIEHIRGVESANSLRILLERKLIRVLGRREIPGRPLVYATTTKFLETFDLRDLKDLPTLKEITDLENASGRPRQQELIFANGEEKEADAGRISGDDGGMDNGNNSQRNDYDDLSG